MKTTRQSSTNGPARVDLESAPAQSTDETLWEVLFANSQGPNETTAAKLADSKEKNATSARKRRKTRRIRGPVVGRLTGFDETGQPLVSFAGGPSQQPRRAISIVPVSAADVDREAILMFERGNSHKPILMGFVQPALSESHCVATPVEVQRDGEKLVFSADKEIVLRCGKASLTLTRAGKVIIRGAYLLSRSSGVNRVKGASVQIN